jgi:peptide/nickel transport system ATP-binding protein
MSAPLLRVRGLSVDLRHRTGTRRLLDDVSLDLAHGEILGLVGESGSGKTLLARAVVRLLPTPNLHIAAGDVQLDGRDLTTAGDTVLRRVRGGAIGMVFQNPTSHLDPVMRVGDQIAEGIRRHDRLPAKAARAASTELLAQVGFADPERRYSDYPHEFSVGMRQRAMIAAALACHPRILIADEPTSALDVTTQAQILRLLTDLRDRRGLAIILISHDPAVVAQTCDRISVLRDGRIVEQGDTRSLLAAPRHPYTVVLIRSNRTEPDDTAPARPPAADPAPPAPVLDVADLVVRFRRGGVASARQARGRRGVVALNGISMRVSAGESMGIVGESGSGKSTLARAVLGLIPITAGRIRFDGADLADDRSAALTALRREAAMVFQDHDNALNPRLTIGQALAEVLAVRGRTAPVDIPRRVEELLDLVALDRAFADRRPRTMSGGQCQRAGIARALAVEPRLLIADECVAGLDVTVQAQIVDLLRGLHRRMGLTLLFIAHDLGLVRSLCERVVVMRRGEIVEDGPAAQIFIRPRHPYTAALIAASPSLAPDRGLRAVRRPPNGLPHDDDQTGEERYA